MGRKSKGTQGGAKQPASKANVLSECANEMNGKTDKPKKHDPWASIENGDTDQTAHQAYYKEPVVEEPKVKNYDRFKKEKRKRLNDGVGAEHVTYAAGLSNGSANGKKRKQVEESSEPVKKMRAENGKPANVFAKIVTQHEKVVNGSNFEEEDDEVTVVVDGKSKKKSFVEKKSKTSKKGGKMVREEKVDYIVEEPDDTIACCHEENCCSGNMHDDDDEEIDDEEILDLNDLTDEEIAVLRAQGLLESDSDMDDEEIDASDMRLNPNDILECHEDCDSDMDGLEDEEEVEDEELEDEEVEMEDEEVDDEEDVSDEESIVSDASVVSLEDATVSRVANVLAKKDTSKGIDLDKFPFANIDSTVSATKAFAWMIHHCDVQSFFVDFFQKNVLAVSRKNPTYYGNLFSTQSLQKSLSEHHLEYGVNINAATYVKGLRYTHNGNGRVYPMAVVDHLKKGHSIQLVNPQAYDDRIWYLCEVLQELFGCFVGANTYLTPAGSAGFAPHWDDIDAFLLQVEGRKFWKVYPPEDSDSELPRESSRNFSDAEMARRAVAFEGWLEPGDMIYIPRGFIHQARTDDKVHSLHVTVSVGRNWSFADYLDKLIPEAVDVLAQSRVKLRKSLPIGMLDMSGVANVTYNMDEQFGQLRDALDRHLSHLRKHVTENLTESGIDLMAREFLRTSLPPRFSPEEKKYSALACGDLLKGRFPHFNAKTQVKLLRRHTQRLIYEDETKCFLVHRVANSRIYEGKPEQNFEMPIRWVDAFSQLTDSYPDWTPLKDLGELQLLRADDRVEFCKVLFNNGLLLVKND